MKLALEDIAKLGDQAALICVAPRWLSWRPRSRLETGWTSASGSRSVTQSQHTAETKLGTELLLKHRTSRPDRVYANAEAAQAITKYRLVRHTGIPQHLPIEITFRAAALKKKYIAIQPPAAFPVDEHQRSEEEQESADQRIASQYKCSPEPRVCREMRKRRGKSSIKLRRTTWNGCAKDVAAEGPAGERGRLPKLVEREVAATTRCSADLQPEKATTRRIAKALRRIREMKMSRDSETVVAHQNEFFFGMP